MTDVVAKAEALASRAIAKNAQDRIVREAKEADEREKAAIHRRETWEFVKKSEPKVAEFLTAVNHFTGPTKSTKVELNDTVVINRVNPDPDPVEEFWDGKLRKIPDKKSWRR